MANAAGIIISDPLSGSAGYGLTETGRQQAGAVDVSPLRKTSRVKILSSPFRRARETAEIVAAAVGRDADSIPVVLEERLRERYFGPSLEGSSNANYELVWAMDAVDPLALRYGEESVYSVAERLRAALQQHVLQDAAASGPADSREPAAIVLVSHGDSLQILQALFNGLDPKEHRSLTHLETAELRLFGRASMSAGSKDVVLLDALRSPENITL